MSVTRIISILIVILVAAVMAGRGLAAGESRAEYYESAGTLTVTNAATNAEALAVEDDKFVQLAPDSYVVMKFPDDSPAQPDGTDAADLRVATVDGAYPAQAEIFISKDDTGWISLGVVEDTTNHEFNLAEPALYVKIAQAGHFIDPAYPRYGFDLDAVTALNTDLVRYGEITSPGEGENVSGTVTFSATLYNDESKNPVDWAVRFGDCKTQTATVFGNVDGHTDVASWDGKFFSFSGDTTEWVAGTYCFVFNPREDTGEAAVRETRFFTFGETEEPVFCDIGWKPPVKLEKHVVNVKATLPIKFFLEDCDGNPLRDGEAEPVLVVNFLGNDDHEAETFELEWKKGSGGYQYLALFRPLYPGEYVAVVTYESQDYDQVFVVVEHGNGKDKQLTGEKLTGQDKDRPGKPEVNPQDPKPRGKPGGKPGKDKKPKKP